MGSFVACGGMIITLPGLFCFIPSENTLNTIKRCLYGLLERAIPIY